MATLNQVSETQIINMALARVGSNQTITSLGDGSNEANQARFWYPQDRDALLCDFPWPWAEAYMNLTQVAGPEIDEQAANAQWSRTYRYPSDCLKVRRLVNTPVQQATTPPQTTGTFAIYPYGNQPWLRPEGDAYPISFSIAHDTEGRLIQTDFYGSGAGVTAIYTAAVNDPTQFSADFADILAWRLAADLGMALSLSDVRRDYAEKMFERKIRTARAVHMNERQSDIPWLRRQSEVIRARWGG